MQYFFTDIDPGYITKFGYGSIAVSTKGYPAIDKFDESQYNFKNGKFYVKQKGEINLRAILPEGKTYRMLLNDFVTSKRPDYTDDNAEEKMIWRVFVSHSVKGEKIYSSFPPAASDILSEVTYATSEKELAFVTKNLHLWEEHADWKTSGLEYKDLYDQTYHWFFNAKPGWQMYIVHTVGYLEVHTTTSGRYLVEDPIMTALIEVE